jgi:hydrogenase maturation protein HypF
VIGTSPNYCIRVQVRGAVQGVGFRPFIYRLASELHLHGWVSNTPQGVIIEAEAPLEALERFLARIEQEKPLHALIQDLQWEFLEPVHHRGFEIRQSEGSGDKTALVLPDFAICPDCLREIFDPNNRRYRYPFTNCTHCGPRFSIIEALPYDRPNTTMRGFPMCEECQAEYEDPLDRRFHAQPNACPRCGPHLELWDRTGSILSTHDDALHQAAEVIRRGEIVAVKGLGGFQLMVDARDPEAVARLRQRKHREEKPLALMYPSLQQVLADCEASLMEQGLLGSSEAPIVLLQRKSSSPSAIAPNAAPGNPNLGIMLPYTPLHHLLMAEVGFPVVATSGNLSDEPICTDEYEAIERLGAIADVFLVHNRPIARHVDDSIVRVMANRRSIIRRARGFAPMPIELEQPAPPVIAVGAHLKNTIGVAVGKDVFLSQHIGDLESLQAYAAFTKVIRDFQTLYDLRLEAIVCDAHPDYRSTQYAEESRLPVIRVQHHYAHVLACMAENRLSAPVLGVSWDGTGYGTDNTIWGSEFLSVDERSFTRIAHLTPFRLPGGDSAVKAPGRVAISLLHEAFGGDFTALTDLEPVQAYSPQELNILKAMLQQGINAPVTSSMGRLFDGVAAIIGLRQRASFEGQAAMELEFALHDLKTDECYPFTVTEITSENALSRSMIMIIWKAMIRAIVDDVRERVPSGVIAAKFHNTLVEMIINVAERANLEQIVLTGGCFQNRYLLERAVHHLKAAGFRPYWHSVVPTNDGSIALGQIVAASRERFGA